MTIQEMDIAKRDLYGTEDIEEESRRTCIVALERLEHELRLIEEKEEYNRAIERCPVYANSDEFRLKFLRSENFDAEVSTLNCAFWIYG